MMNERAMIDGLRLAEAERSMHESNAAARELDAIAKDLLPALEASGVDLPAGETPGARVMAWLLHDQLNPPGPYRRGSASSLANAFTLIRRHIQATTGEGDAPTIAAMPAWILDELRQLAAMHRDYRGTVERHPAGSDTFRLRYYRHEDYQRLREDYYPIVEPARVPEPSESIIADEAGDGQGQREPAPVLAMLHGKTANARVANLYVTTPESTEWSAKQVGHAINATDAAVRQTAAWKANQKRIKGSRGSMPRKRET